ncbi:MAG: ribbon-helix-helix protein, CopG family [Gammaproteobacteria bacterium]
MEGLAIEDDHDKEDGSVIGKCDAETKLRLPSDMLDEIDRRAHVAHATRSEYIRIALAAHLYGKTKAMRLASQRVKMVLSVGDDCAPDLETD